MTHGSSMVAFLALGAWMLCVPAAASQVAPETSPSIGDALARIQAMEPYQATLFAKDLMAPDGLAFDPAGNLCVVVEGEGAVLLLPRSEEQTPLVTDLHSPEALCFDPEGRLYVAEDGAGGRLMQRDREGTLSIIAQGLDAPEGVLFHDGVLYLTESDLQLVGEPTTARTRLLAFTLQEQGWSEAEVLVDRGFPLSFSEIVAVGKHSLILANETAGGLITTGLLRYDRKTKTLTTFATGLVSPEGLCTTPTSDDGFPLYVAEEDIDGGGHGRISKVARDGTVTVFATGFQRIEDVLVDEEGVVHVSEDTTGWIVRLAPMKRLPADVGSGPSP